MREEFLLAITVFLVLAAAAIEPETAAPERGEKQVHMVRVTETPSTTALDTRPVTALVREGCGTELREGRYALKIAPGALSKTCTITLRACEEDGTVGCDALPLGLVLQVPAVLAVNLKGTDAGSGNRYVVCGWNAITGGWEELGGRYDADSGAVLATVSRLTRFAVRESTW
jgi:hypothetical protein